MYFFAPRLRFGALAAHPGAAPRRLGGREARLGTRAAHWLSSAEPSVAIGGDRGPFGGPLSLTHSPHVSGDEAAAAVGGARRKSLARRGSKWGERDDDEAQRDERTAVRSCGGTEPNWEAGAVSQSAEPLAIQAGGAPRRALQMRTHTHCGDGDWRECVASLAAYFIPIRIRLRP